MIESDIAKDVMLCATYIRPESYYAILMRFSSLFKMKSSILQTGMTEFYHSAGTSNVADSSELVQMKINHVLSCNFYDFADKGNKANQM